MSPSLPHEGKIYHGKVIKIESFGVFIEIEGIRSHGLVHISQLASSRVESASDVVSMGDEVYVKVLSVDDNHGKPRISLSMKYCDQSTGEDRDKNGVDAEMDVRRRQPRPSDPEPLQLGAIYNTKCTRCGGHGHVAMECFNTGGSKYDLIPEDDIESTRSAPTGTHRDGNAGRATSRGMGRGRTATLPAWMTTGESNGYESVAGEKDGRHDHREKGRNSRFGDVEREYQPKHSHREDFSGGSLQSMRGGLPGVSSGGKGRGRGATLPAWMTSGESDLSLGGEIENHEKLHKARSSRDRDDSRDGRGHKKSKKRKHDDDSDDDHNRKRKKHHKKHKHKHHKKDEKHKKSKDEREKERSMSPDRRKPREPKRSRERRERSYSRRDDRSRERTSVTRSRSRDRRRPSDSTSVPDRRKPREPKRSRERRERSYSRRDDRSRERTSVTRSRSRDRRRPSDSTSRRLLSKGRESRTRSRSKVSEGRRSYVRERSVSAVGGRIRRGHSRSRDADTRRSRSTNRVRRYHSRSRSFSTSSSRSTRSISPSRSYSR